MKKIILLAISTVALSACNAATGPAYHRLDLSQPKSGKTQIVVYRPDRFAAPRTPMVKINGVDKCEMPGNSFFVVDSPAKKTAISASLWDLGASEVVFNAKSGERNFVKIDFDTDKNTGSGFGAVGAILSGSSGNEGPFIIQRVFPEQAERELKTARLVDGCR